jgi:hypothetical protein
MRLWRNNNLSRRAATRVGSMAALCLAGSVLAGAAAAPAPAGDPMIFSVWQGDGQIVKVGNEAAGIIGTFGGMLFTVANGTPTDLGTIACPGIFSIDLKQGTAVGTGGCVFNANDGAQAYGTFDCKGPMTDDCVGKFQINGGSGRLSGVKGESGFVLRTRMREMAVQPSLVISQRAMGVATWPGLRILLPNTGAAAKQAPAK